MEKVKFINKNQAVFFTKLRSRVDEYFQESNMTKFGDNSLIVKALIMTSLYIIPYFYILIAKPNIPFTIILLIIMGLGISGLGMGVMHDAVHGTFSEKKWLNKLAGSSLYFLGGNVLNWDVQHNQLHHTYTNIHDLDEDITGKFLLRLHTDEKLKFHHRFQHIYAFFLYSLMTVSFLWKDFKEIKHFKELSKTGVVKAFNTKDLSILFLSKIAYIIFIFVIPMTILDISVLQWLAGFLIMHSVSGLILSIVFQLAHIVEGTNPVVPDADGNVDNAWAVHQLKTTSNFFGNSRLFSWFVGGLDYQIEHHLFPKISHIHYGELSKIVARTAKEYGIEYNAKNGFWHALGSHVSMLRKLGTLQTV